MDCRRFQDIVAEFENQCLKPAEQAQADLHLMECPACRSVFEIARGQLDLLSEQEKEELAGSILLHTSGSACHRLQDLICDYVDGVLHQDVVDLVSGHLAHCAPCCSLASNLKELKEILPQLARFRSDERLTESVLAATVGAKLRPYGPSFPRLHELWNRLVQRPRFSFEAAYVGTLVVAIFLGNPFPAMRSLSVHTLEAVSQLMPRDLEKNSSVILRPLQALALDISQRDQRVRELLAKAHVRGETAVAAAVKYQLRDVQAWLQKGFQSLHNLAKRLWTSNRKIDSQDAGR